MQMQEPENFDSVNTDTSHTPSNRNTVSMLHICEVFQSYYYYFISSFIYHNIIMQVDFFRNVLLQKKRF